MNGWNWHDRNAQGWNAQGLNVRGLDARGWKVLGCVTVAALTVLAPTPGVAQVTAYAFVPSSHDDHLITVIDTRAAAVIGAAIPVGNQPVSAVPTPDGRRVYVATAGTNSVTVIDVATRATVGAPIAVGSLPYGIAITPDGRKAYVANRGSHTVSVIDIATNTVTGTIPVGLEPVSLAVRPDGQRVYVANSSSNSLSVIDVVTDAVVGAPIDVVSAPWRVIVAPDGQRAYVATGADLVLVVDLVAGLVTGGYTDVHGPAGMATTRDGTTLLVANEVAANVGFVDLVSGTIDNTPPVFWSPQDVAMTPDGQTAYVINSYTSANSVSRIDIASRTVYPTTIPVGQGPWSFGAFMGPAILTTECAGCGPLPIASDADLAPPGFGSFVPFHTGALALTGAWTTSRTLSLLAGGGTIDTGAFDAIVTGDVINDGALTKQGTGRLTLAGTSMHAGGTTVAQGAMIVTGTHTPAMRLQGGTLGGDGAVGAIEATAGVIDPGVGGPGVLHAAQATLTPAVSLVVQINGQEAGTGYDRLDVSGVASLAGATLTVQLGYTPAPGATFTIVTHASGTFAGLPEGALFTVGGTTVRITYQGGPTPAVTGSDVVLIVDRAPAVAGLSDQTIAAGSTLGPIAFTVADDVTAADALVVTASSSDAALLPTVDLVIGGSGATRTLSATPVPGASGTTTIVVTVSDGWQTAQQTFTLSVLPLPVYYLAEGASGGFFSTELVLANPNGAAAPAVMRFFRDDGTTFVQDVTLAATSRTTIRVDEIAGLEAAAFSTAVTSTSGLPLLVERTMWWDAAGYGAHTEQAGVGAAAEWYFAEGAQGFFRTYFLLLNPHAVDTVAHVTFFVEGGSALQRDYVVPATSRLTVDAGREPALRDRSFGARVAFDLPGMAERAMYFGETPTFSGGHAAAGVTAPSATWFLAEGATGAFFDTFVLIANPNDAAAHVTLTYLPDTGVPIAKAHVIAGHERLTVNLATEDPALASAAVSTRVDADRPVIVERSQYWPRPAWHDGHASAGVTATATRWGLAEGRVGGSTHAQTYILIANPGTQAAAVTATFLRTDGTTVVKTFTVAPTSRFTLAVAGAGGSVPELIDESFGTLIQSTHPVIVERSMYTDAGGVTWAAGTNATAARLP